MQFITPADGSLLLDNRNFMVLFLISLKRDWNSLFRKQSLLQYNLVPYAPYFQLATLLFQPPPQDHWKHQTEMSWQQSWAEAIRCHRLSSHLCIYPGLLCLSLINSTGNPWCVFPHWFWWHQCGAQGCCEGYQCPEESWEGKFPWKWTSLFLTAECLKRRTLENIQKTLKRRRKSRNPKATAINLIIHDHWTARFSLDSWKVFPT